MRLGISYLLTALFLLANIPAQTAPAQSPARPHLAPRHAPSTQPNPSKQSQIPSAISPETTNTTPPFGGFYAAPYFSSGDDDLMSTLTGDFNHDGKPDVATVDRYGGMTVLLNSGGGKFQSGIFTRFVSPDVDVYGSKVYMDSALAADLNEDGYTDIILQKSSGSNINSPPTLFVMFNLKNGKFGNAVALTLPVPNYQTQLLPFSFGVAKTTTSGHLDIVTAAGYQPSSGASAEILVKTFLNSGHGSFTGGEVMTVASGLQGDASNYLLLAFSDVNHDGNLDLLLETYPAPFPFPVSSTCYLYVMPGNGNGTFQFPSQAGPVTFPSHGYSPSSYLIAQNLTNDPSNADLILSNSEGVWVAMSDGYGSFKTPQLIVNSDYIDQILITDVNGDGKNDLIAVGSGILLTYLGHGDGSFSGIGATAIVYATQLSEPNFQTVAEDFNGDGKIDFVNSDARGNVEVGLGNGDGSFRSTPALYSTKSTALSPYDFIYEMTPDLNGDGVPDLLFSKNGDLESGVANRSGGFTYQTALPYSASLSNFQVTNAVGDFNGDGKQDVVLLPQSGGSIGIALSNGDGTLKAPTIATTSASSVCNLGPSAAGDLNGDGKLDLIVAYFGTTNCAYGATPAMGLLIALGNGDGTLKPPTLLPMDLPPEQFTLARFHGNKAPLDLVVVFYEQNATTTSVEILQGKGDGTFGPPVLLDSDHEVYEILTDDFNQDGKADLTLIGYSDQGTYYDEGAFLFAGNGDGTFATPTSVTVVPSGADANFGGYADLNGDGILDLFGNWLYGSLSVYLGTGHGTFATPINYLLNSYRGPVAVGKFLGDNTQNLLFASGAGTAFFMNQGGTTLTLKPSATTLTTGQSVTLASTLTATLTGQPTLSGTIDFYDGATILGSTSVDGSLATTKLAVGTHTLTAKYSGDNHFNPNTSAAVIVKVTAVSTLTLSVAPASLTFPATAIGTTSAPQVVTLKNIGNTPISLDAFTLTGANTKSFLKSSTCTSQLASGATCAIAVEFTPAVTGALSATLAIVDSATGSPQSVTLQGTASAASAVTLTITPASLNFAATKVGASSPAQITTLKNTGSAPITFGTITFIGANTKSFAISAKTCPATLAADSTCTLSIQFKPAKTGPLSATLSMDDNTAASPQGIAVTGTGN